MMDWNDPAARAALIERVGVAAYNRELEEHRRSSIVKTVNGHNIRPVMTRFGRLFVVGTTGSAFATMAQAEAFARKAAPGAPS